MVTAWVDDTVGIGAGLIRPQRFDTDQFHHLAVLKEQRLAINGVGLSRANLAPSVAQPDARKIWIGRQNAATDDQHGHGHPRCTNP